MEFTETQLPKGTLIFAVVRNDKFFVGRFAYALNFRLVLFDVEDIINGQKNTLISICERDFVYKFVVTPEDYNIDIQTNVIPLYYTIINLKQQRLHRLKKLIYNIIYLTTYDYQFQNVIDDLKCQTEITIFLLHPLTTIITIKSKNNVYIFDLKMVNSNKHFLNDLKDLFEQGNIVKNVHNAQLTDITLNTYSNALLKNVFDTQVADYKLNGEIELRDIKTCFIEVLNLPKEFVQRIFKVPKHPNRYPLNMIDQRCIALCAGYLSILKNVFSDFLLEEVEELTKKYMTI